MSDVAKGSPVSAYQEPVNPNICHFMGVKNEKSTYSLLDPTNPTNGVTVKYVDGEFAFGDYRSTQIDIICDSDDSKTFGCVSTGCEEKTGNVINYHFVLKSKYGCPGSGSGRPFLWPVGILGLLALLLIPVFIIYWPVGIIVNKFIRKKEGIEIVPNVTFWKDLPFLVKDGFLFLFKDIIYEKIITKIVAKVRGRPSYEPA